MADRTFEYVIVGAGSAGCVLANRLSAAGASVLLLEAGEPDDEREIDIPAAFSELFRTDVDWEYYTEPQSKLNDRELYWPRGKVLGGSSSINAMIYMRGHPDDYDDWASFGNEGWGYDDLMPYFKRAQNQERGESAHHGTGGPLTVTELRSPNELSRTFVEAGEAIGLPHNDDFNDGTQEGVGLYQVTQQGGSRLSAASAYLKPVLDRSNLDVETGAHVTRVRFDGTKAVGVDYVQNGNRVEIDAGEEVLLCGGTINSPQLLMLSGVGPTDHLAEHDIDVVVDRPGVGRNLQDHLNTGVVYDSTKPITLDDADSIWNLIKYLVRKRGPLTSNVAEAGGFAKTTANLDVPDIQFHFGPAYFIRHGFGNPDEGHGFSVGALLLRPESRGRITLRSADPFDDPAIDPRYLSVEKDLDVLCEGVKISREIAQAEPFDEYRGDEILPEGDIEDDDDVVDHIRETAETLYHPVGTCAMGTDDMSVVDDRLRVHGTEGLRVVDASVMPTLVGGNTNAPTITIAEKAADMIAT